MTRNSCLKAAMNVKILKLNTMKQRMLVGLWFFFSLCFCYAEGNNIPVRGRVTDDAGETLIGATVFIPQTGKGTITDLNGQFQLMLEKGSYSLQVTYVGYEAAKLDFVVKEHPLELAITMESGTEKLDEVVVSSRSANHNIRETEMGVVKLDIKSIKQIPAFMGETDVLKSIQLLPGVQSGGDGFSGFNVRGGSADQNLVLLDDATIYNASHLMGFFSVFNADAVEDVKIYKGDIPAAYGGRLSSLLKVNTPNQIPDDFSVQGGVGTISSKLSAAGSVANKKVHYLVAGRRTYADLFLPLAKDTAMHDNSLYFYDLNAKVNVHINDANRLYFSGYLGRDVFGFQDMMGMKYGNSTASFRWNHIQNEQLSTDITAHYASYLYKIHMASGITEMDWLSSISDYGIKGDFNLFYSHDASLKGGASVTYHSFYPGKIVGKNNEVLEEVPENFAIEYGLYLSNDHALGNVLNLRYGLRYSAFQNVGPALVYHYDKNYQAIDSTRYYGGEAYHTYGGLEPRLNATFILNPELSLKAGYARTMQYLQLASNSSTGFPLDIWFSSSPNTRPQISDQVAMGIFKNINQNAYEISLEGYYKKMQNQIDFKDFADILFNPKLEGEIRTGDAKSYGVELLVRKNSGLFTGWVSYTLSKSTRKIKGINDNEEYDANYDKPHNLAVVGSYQFTPKLLVSASWVYSSGAPMSLPTGRFEYGNYVVPVYSGRNEYRLPDYHRLDLSVTYKTGEKKKNRFRSEINLSAYNVYNRKNAFTIFFQADDENPNKMNANKLSLFGIVPAITYSFWF